MYWRQVHVLSGVLLVLPLPDEPDEVLVDEFQSFDHVSLLCSVGMDPSSSGTHSLDLYHH